MSQPITIPGILVIDKPQDITSARVVAQIKRKFNFKKVGHAGTLDPMATGVLVLLLNNATKLCEQVQAGAKVYTGTITLGMTSDTDDSTGKILSKNDVEVGNEELEKACARFVGEILQYPPKVSAIKVGGRRAYEMARKGEDVVLEPRQVKIEYFKMKRISNECVSFEVRCSKGTYIRSLARDLGEMLGCGGLLSGLRREVSEPFSLKDTKLLDEVALQDIIVPNMIFKESRECHL